MHDQLTFDLEHRVAKGRDDFLVTGSNEEAVLWLDRWPDWPAPFLVLCGPAGSGKSHLLSVWATRAQAQHLQIDDLIKKPTVDLSGNHMWLDDADKIGGNRQAQEGVFHLYNDMKATGKSLLLAAREPARDWNIEIPDLVSRLRAAPMAQIHTPDDMLLGALLLKLFSDRQLSVGAGVIDYLTRHMERSFEAAQKLVQAMDQASLQDKRKISIPLAREVLNRD